ncbi:unnamed protein product [Arabidopsis thaliana]|uniref:Uncharacterized protein n=1 Tax=Arabidopsis thaliana TaxID=3702 RepID=A0A654F457_ARATH|nr:unnamed protein product [Arabidopsis thaliana]
MKNSSLLFILIVVFVISSSENGIMIGEAKKCSNSWICEGDEKCKEKCMTDYKGNGTCYYPSPPSKQHPEFFYPTCWCGFDC